MIDNQILDRIETNLDQFGSSVIGEMQIRELLVATRELGRQAVLIDFLEKKLASAIHGLEAVKAELVEVTGKYNYSWLANEKAETELDRVKAFLNSKGGKVSALDTQVAGDHYKQMTIQPVEFCQSNRLPYCESAVIKYVCRHRAKNGAEDIRKAIHFLELLLELEYPSQPK